MMAEGAIATYPSRSVEERLAKVEGGLEELSKRIDDLNNSMTEGFIMINKRINDLGKTYPSGSAIQMMLLGMAIGALCTSAGVVFTFLIMRTKRAKDV